MNTQNSLTRFTTRLAGAALISLGLLASSFTAPALADIAPGEGVNLVAPSQEDVAPVQDYGFKRGTLVDFASAKPTGSIIIVSKTNRLYYVLGNGKAVMFRVATARKGFGWSGTHKVSMKTQWPEWRPPTEMRKRHPELPVYMKGGVKNPLGARAMYLGSSIYRIHGTNEPSSIGKSASSGCIRMLNADVTELYRHVKVGTAVVVM